MLFLALTVLLALAAVSCGGEPKSSVDGSVDGGGAAGSPGHDAGGAAASPGHDAGGASGSTPSDAGDADRDNPCLVAEDITELGFGHGTIDPSVGESNYFRFSAAGGAFIKLRTKAFSAETSTSMIPDPAITLYNADGSTLLASNDNEAPLEPESELVFRPVEDAGFCLRVEHTSSWLGNEPMGEHLLTYDIFLSRYAELVGKHDADQEPNDDVSSAQLVEGFSVQGDRHNWDIVGELASDTDVDVYRLELPPGTGGVEVRFSPAGPGGAGVEGNGSTLHLDPVELTDEWGNVFGRAAGGATSIRVPTLPAGQDVYLHVRRAAGSTLGANDFYRLRGYQAPSDSMLLYSEAETMAGQNDTTETAEPVEGAHTAQTLSYNFLWYNAAGFMQAPAANAPLDIDAWSFPALAGSKVQLFCWSARVGSGLLEPRFSIVNELGTELRAGVETPDCDLAWSDRAVAVAPPLILPDTGTYTLRVTAAGQRDDVASRWYECRWFVSILN